MKTSLTITRTSPPPEATGTPHHPPTVQVARAARTHVTERLGEWRAPGLIDEAALVTSELVTNAVRHGHAPVGLDIHLVRGGRGAPDRLRIEVWDRGPGFDAGLVRERWARDDDDLAEGGRGLRLTDALCENWGTRVENGRHVVWACLCLTHTA
ncbi:ATP-binding protein [Streptomyces sp. NPDC018964]|uniref:ATP-binding protein n=1 Tax=unclassified Streptomyces TaxID=2593676 RepID=UPI00378B87CF